MGEDRKDGEDIHKEGRKDDIDQCRGAEREKKIPFHVGDEMLERNDILDQSVATFIVLDEETGYAQGTADGGVGVRISSAVG